MKRTAERSRPDPLIFSAVRFTDFVSGSRKPSDEEPVPKLESPAPRARSVIAQGNALGKNAY